MTKRNYHLDNAKFILITLVSIGHFISPMTDKSIFLRDLFFFIYMFHMPLFIFISGYFSKSFYKDGKVKIEKILSYLVLFFVFQVINNLILGDNITMVQLSNISWYLFATVIWLCTIPFIDNLKPKYVLMIAFFLAVMSGFDKTATNAFAIARIVNYYPFFLLGYYCSKDTLNKITNKKYIIPSIIVLLIITFIVFNRNINVYWLRPLLSGKNSYASLSLRPVYLCAFLRILYYPVIIIMGIAILNVIPRGKTIISNPGSRSLQVYFLHMFAYRYFNIFGLYDPLIKIKYWQLILILIGIATSIVCSLKIFEYPFKKLMNLKWNILKKSH